MRICTAIVGLLLLGLWLAPAGASPQEELAKAAEQKQIVFLLVTQTQPPAIGVEEMREMVQQVASQVKNSTVVEMDRSFPGNANFVAKHGLAGAPTPLVLLVGRNGLVTGGVTAAQATPERLLALVPTPKKEEVLQALEDKKVVFVEVVRKDMNTRDAAHAACSAACSQLVGKSVVVAIDMDDPAEKNFLTQLGVDPLAIEPVTLVLNSAGQIAGNYKGVTTAEELVAASQKKVGGCAPGACGSGKSCAPPK
jgi:hypothetical protein